MQYIRFRNLVGVSHTEEEAKALAEEVYYACMFVCMHHITTDCLIGSVSSDLQITHYL